jgi:hypothetical protein
MAANREVDCDGVSAASFRGRSRRRQLRKALQAAERVDRPVFIYSSPFSRTRRTAELAAEAAGLPTDTSPVQVHQDAPGSLGPPGDANLGMLSCFQALRLASGTDDG